MLRTNEVSITESNYKSDTILSMCDTFNIAEGFHHPISKVKCKVEHGEEEITGDKRRLEEMRGNERK